ncbi:hypothetical protein VNO78_29065 [Psophocarpus tetragonolobus]|uniref:ATPase AAA-type core domain-containing protein n=1 Tax=Psophocarpus tetragonolobus TaxID=3891 RepID=A0AAN9X2G4_PSOTE
MTKYIPHVLSTYQNIKASKRTIKIHYMGSSKCIWQKRELTHPASFNTLALDQEQKQAIIDDLDRFLSRKELYKKVGKPWKRDYLLYGTPGTGKSTLIAAMANHLKFDVYDLELSSVCSNLDLVRALRDTLLLRLDMHIHLSFLKGKAFRILASNYLSIEVYHPLFEQIEGLLEKIQVTHVVVAEQLIRNDYSGFALEELVKFLKEIWTMKGIFRFMNGNATQLV